MIKVTVNRGEWWPVYSICEGESFGHTFDMPETQYQKLKEKQDSCFQAFQELQEELRLSSAATD